MRLYFKLFALIALTVAAQRYVLDDLNLSANWFTLRCFYACTVHNDPMFKRLVAEEQHRLYHPDEPVYINASQ